MLYGILLLGIRMIPHRIYSAYIFQGSKHSGDHWRRCVRYRRDRTSPVLFSGSAAQHTQKSSVAKASSAARPADQERLRPERVSRRSLSSSRL